MRDALADDALDCTVFPFVLQPLLENAVRHRLSAKPEGGEVDISAQVRAGRPVLCVRDDGVGVDPGGTVGTGVGLSVLREQLRTRYGAAASLTISTVPGPGFTARIELPAEGDATAAPARSFTLAAVPESHSSPISEWEAVRR